MNRAGDITIMVAKDELLSRLRENREKHRGLYEKAWDGYCKMARKALEDMLVLIKDKKPITGFIGYRPPEDHTGDYDDVIDMMEMALDSKIELSQQQFKQYVKDDWNWTENWTASNSEYLSA